MAYTGNLYYAANADSLDTIINDILPQIKSDYKYYIIGKYPESVYEKYKNNSRLIFCGRVDDLREYVEKASVFLSPVAYGNGIKTEIVGAMAMKMPVVTNSVGAEGINAVPGRDYLVSDDPKEIALAVDMLFNNQDFAKEIGERAGRFAYEHFRWDKVQAVYQELGL